MERERRVERKVVVKCTNGLDNRSCLCMDTSKSHRIASVGNRYPMES
jgi:hypothetical protein